MPRRRRPDSRPGASHADRGRAPSQGSVQPTAPDKAGPETVAGRLLNLQHQVGNHAIASSLSADPAIVQRRVSVEMPRSGTALQPVGKLGIVDGEKDIGGHNPNLRAKPSASGSAHELADNTHVWIEGTTSREGYEWAFVSPIDGDSKGTVGWVATNKRGAKGWKYLLPGLPLDDVGARLYRVQSGDRLVDVIEKREFYGSNVKEGRFDQSSIARAILEINERMGRGSYFTKAPRPEDPLSRSNYQVLLTRPGKKIWMPSVTTLKSMDLKTGRFGRDLWEKAKQWAGRLAKAAAFIAGLPIGALESIRDLAEGVWDILKALFTKPVQAVVGLIKGIKSLFTSSEARRKLLDQLAGWIDERWNARGFLGKWFGRGRLVGYLTMEVLGLKGAAAALKGTKVGKVISRGASKLTAAPRAAYATLTVAITESSAFKKLTETKFAKGVKAVKEAAAQGKAKLAERIASTRPAKAVKKVGELTDAALAKLRQKQAALQRRLKIRAVRKKRAKRLARAIRKGDDAASIAEAKRVLRNYGDINEVRKALDAGWFGRGDRAADAAGYLEKARMEVLDEIATGVQKDFRGRAAERLDDTAGDVRIEMYDAGRPGIRSDRDITVRAVMSGAAPTPEQARVLARLSVEAVTEAERRLKKYRGEKGLDTNYYTELHEDVFRGADKAEAASIARDQSVVGLAEIRLSMTRREWRQYKRSQLQPLQRTPDAPMAAEIAADLKRQFKEAENLATSVRSMKNRDPAKARRMLVKALNDPTTSQRRIRQHMAIVKMVEPDAFGTRAATIGVTKHTQPLKNLAQQQRKWDAARQKRQRGEKLSDEERALLSGTAGGPPAPHRVGTPEAPLQLDAPIRTADEVSSGGWKGSAPGAEHGAFRALLDGEEVIVKRYPPGGRDVMERELAAARAAHASGYGHPVYGHVHDPPNLSWAMGRQPGQRPIHHPDVEDAISGDRPWTPELVDAHVQSAQAQSWVTQQTLDELDDFADRMLEQGFYARGDIEYFVDPGGRLRPLDFQTFFPLPPPGAARDRAIRGHREAFAAERADLEYHAAVNARRRFDAGKDEPPLQPLPERRTRPSHEAARAKKGRVDTFEEMAAVAQEASSPHAALFRHTKPRGNKPKNVFAAAKQTERVLYPAESVMGRVTRTPRQEVTRRYLAQVVEAKAAPIPARALDTILREWAKAAGLPRRLRGQRLRDRFVMEVRAMASDAFNRLKLQEVAKDPKALGFE